MLLAELEIRHSRDIAPTRRVALGELWLPTEPAPGFGGILLAGIVAAFGPRLDDETRDDLDLLTDQLERGRRIPQPRLRYRLQVDVIGLDRSRHQLVGEGEDMALDLDRHGGPLPQVLGALYAAGRISYKARPQVFALLRRAARWEGEAGPKLMAYLTGDEASYRAWRTPANDARWALGTLGFEAGDEPERVVVQRRYRDLVRRAHPDAGGAAETAGRRITELTEARRILLAEQSA